MHLPNFFDIPILYYLSRRILNNNYKFINIIFIISFKPNSLVYKLLSFINFKNPFLFVIQNIIFLKAYPMFYTLPISILIKQKFVINHYFKILTDSIIGWLSFSTVPLLSTTFASLHNSSTISIPSVT